MRVIGSAVSGMVVAGEIVGSSVAFVSDSFTAISGDWSLIQGGGDSCTVESVDGELVMHVTVGGVGADLWFNGDEGPIFGQLVSGDFDAVATVRVRNGDDSGPCPSNDAAYRQFGLSMQDPDRTVLNYVSISIGDSAQTDLRAEWKTTVDSVSVFDSISAPSGAGQVRCRRTGQMFDLYYRPTQGSSWTLVQSIDRTADPLPDELNVGLICYASTTDPDITGFCDSIVIR